MVEVAHMKLWCELQAAWEISIYFLHGYQLESSVIISEESEERSPEAHCQAVAKEDFRNADAYSVEYYSNVET